MNTVYEMLPVADLTAQRTVSSRNRAPNTPSRESMEQDAADAEAILKGANLAEKLSPKTAYEATEKYLIETRPMNAESKISESSVNTMRQKGIRKPHYTRLFLLDQHIIF